MSLFKLQLPTAMGLALLASACVDPLLQPGEIGTARYFGEILWNGEERMLPPVRDWDGTNYIAFRETNETGCSLANAEVAIGSPAGGWQTGCALREGTRRVHGWVGVVAGGAFLWTGDKLVGVGGRFGVCQAVLDTDPASRADINFEGIIPWVWTRPDRLNMVALISSPGDPLPFHVNIDLIGEIYTDPRAFEPSSAENVEVVGTGGNLNTRTGVMLVRYDLGNESVGEAIFLDQRGREFDRIKVGAIRGLGQDDVVGFVQLNERNQGAALLSNGDVVTFDTNGSINTTPSFAVEGVHLWNDELWATGIQGDPVVAPLTPEGIGSISLWNTSVETAQSYASGVEVIDDRNTPREILNWTDAESAIGPAPFVSNHSLSPYTPDSAGWVIGGPSFLSGNGNECRSVAFVPTGVSYP